MDPAIIGAMLVLGQLTEGHEAGKHHAVVRSARGNEDALEHDVRRGLA